MTNNISTNKNEEKAAAAFSQQSAVFDALYAADTIIQYKRKRVRDHLKKYLPANSKILELNCGTGEDAIWLAKQGHRVHATDISPGMSEVLQKKIRSNGSEIAITSELCSFTSLDQLYDRGPYDMIFSNFAGLNCTGELDKVLRSFSSLLKPNGIVTLVLLPRFCLWEFLLLFKGMFKTATRRLFSARGVKAHVEGKYFTCWYYDPSYIRNQLKKEFTVVSVEGLCSLVPPSYIAHFAEKHSSVYKFLESKENKWKSTWPWKYIGDYYIITLQKRAG